MISYVLTDIEGTTTPITFVHDVLFPYSKAHLEAYVQSHASDATVRSCLDLTAKTVWDETQQRLDDQGAVRQLLRWIAEDRKHPALKTLQGLIWRHGYEAREYQADVYEDVKPMLEKWQRGGAQLGIYSSGSVEAQKLLFRYSNRGDLTPLFRHYFDTAVGGKREEAAYRKIVGELGVAAERIVFLSDVTEELDAAGKVGLKTVQLVRPGTKPGSVHPTAQDFRDVDQLLAKL